MIFTYAGNSCSQWSIKAFDKSTSTGAANRYTELIIPGKDGSVLISDKRRNNVTVTYGCVIYQNAVTNLEAFRSWLLSQIGYQNLSDSLHTDEFYKAAVVEDFDAYYDEDRDMVKFTVTFSRKPQRYLLSGSSAVSFTSNGSIYNPTQYASKPKIRVYGTGTVTIGGQSLTISSNNGFTDIDCEVMEAYYGTASRNANIRFYNNEYFEIKPGSNSISLGTGITKLEITPNWYRI